MKRITEWTIAVLFVAAIWVAALVKPAEACSIAADRLTGGYWIQFYQGGPGTALTDQWGDWTTPAIQIQVINKSCNDLQSFGNISGAIHWYGYINAPSYAIGDGPVGTYRCGPWGAYVCYWTNWSRWINPNEGAVFNWQGDGSRWDRAVSCAPTNNYYYVGGVVRVQWQCTHQQSGDGGRTWGGTSQMVLNPAL